MNGGRPGGLRRAGTARSVGCHRPNARVSHETRFTRKQTPRAVPARRRPLVGPVHWRTANVCSVSTAAPPVAFVVWRGHRVPLVAVTVAVEAIAARAEVAGPLPVAVAIEVAFAIPGGAADVAGLVHATVVVAVLVAALVLRMPRAEARLVAVARLDLALHVATPGAAYAAVFDPLRTPAVGPAAVAGVVSVDVRLPAVARTALRRGHVGLR